MKEQKLKELERQLKITNDRSRRAILIARIKLLKMKKNKTKFEEAKELFKSESEGS